jgi:hypothetical protein
MKTVITLTLLLLATSFAYAQDALVNKETGLVTFTGVVHVNSALSKAELYSRAREWFARTYNDADKVLSMDDRESGKLLGRAYQDIRIYSSFKMMHYLIGIFVKDGRYRYEITNIRYQDYGADAQKLPAEMHFVDGYYKNGKTKPTSEMYRQATDEAVRELVASLEVGMKGTDAASVREDF